MFFSCTESGPNTTVCLYYFCSSLFKVFLIAFHYVQNNYSSLQYQSYTNIKSKVLKWNIHFYLMVTHCNLLMYKHNRMTSFKLKALLSWSNHIFTVAELFHCYWIWSRCKSANKWLKISKFKKICFSTIVWYNLICYSFFFVKLIFIAVLINLINLWYLPFWHRLPVGDALQAWRTTSSAQRTEFHLLMRYPCKGILQTKQTSVPNEAMVPSERTNPQTEKPTGHLDVVLKQT